MRYSGRDLARDTYAGIDLQPARRRVVSPQPVQPSLMEREMKVRAEHYAVQSIRSFAKRNGRAPTAREAERIAANSAALVQAMYPRITRDD